MKPLLRALILWLLLAVEATGAPRDFGIVFIVNRQNPTRSLSRRELIDYYQKTIRQWPDGAPVRFIDREVGTPERKMFLSRVLRQSESAVELFWFGRKLRSGDSVPLQVGSDSVMIETVKALAGAIGYVSPSAPLDDPKIKRLEVTE